MPRQRAGDEEVDRPVAEPLELAIERRPAERVQRPARTRASGRGRWRSRPSRDRGERHARDERRASQRRLASRPSGNRKKSGITIGKSTYVQPESQSAAAPHGRLACAASACSEYSRLAAVTPCASASASISQPSGLRGRRDATSPPGSGDRDPGDGVREPPRAVVARRQLARYHVGHARPLTASAIEIGRERPGKHADARVVPGRAAPATRAIIRSARAAVNRSRLDREAPPPRSA